MERRTRRPWTAEFTKATKKRIIFEQQGRCAVCQREEYLEVHHVVPVTHGGGREKKNGLGVCPPCHACLDALALKERLYYPEVVMTLGIWYTLHKTTAKSNYMTL